MSKYKLSKALPILFFLIAVGLFFWYQEANATYKKPPPKPQTTQEQSQDQHQKQGQDQNQHQTSEANAHSDSVAQSDAAANNEGVEQSVVVAGDMVAASTAYAAGAYTNMECGATTSASKQDVSEGFSLSSIIPWWTSRQIRDCWRRDDANWLDSMGLHVEAIESRCATRSMLIKYKTQEECRNTIIGSLKVRQGLEAENVKLRKERDTALVILKERDKEALRLKEEVAEKRLIEATSK